MIKDEHLTFLIEGCHRNEERSQMALYRQFYSYGMGICLRYATSRELALEILNDGFLKIFLKIDQYDTSQPFKPWLRKILVNAAIDHYRKYSKQKKEEKSRGERGPSAYNEALDQLAFDDLLGIMQQLPHAYRLVFNLYVVEGRTHAEIAKQLGISIGSSKSNLSKARGKIKEMLGRSHGIYFKSKAQR